MFRSVISHCRLMPTSGEKKLPRSNSSLSATHRSKSARAAAALSASLFRPRQEATARLLGMKRLTYHRIETGARHIHFADLAAICDAFHCAPGELLADGQLAAAFTRAAHALLPDALE